MVSENEIKHILGSKIYYRAVDYFQDGNVIKILEVEPKNYHAFVEGSGGMIYDVSIDLNSHDFFCNCPYNDLCKHIGAVLLELNNKLHSKRKNTISKEKSIKNELMTLENKIASSKVSKINLNKKINYYHSNLESILPFKNDSEVKKSSNEKFELVFTIEKIRHNNSITIAPCLQYIKKDGTPGRLQNYNPEKLNTKPSSEENNLLYQIEKISSLSYRHEKGCELTHLISFNDLKSFTGCKLISKSTKKEIHFYNFDKHNLAFKPSSMISDSNIFFTPLCTIKQKGSDPEFQALLNKADIQAGTILFLDEANLYYCKDPEIYDFLSKLYNRIAHSDLDTTDIKYLKAFCSKNLAPKISVEFNSTEANIHSVKPDCILKGHDTNGCLGFFIDFSYLGKEFPFARGEEILNLPLDKKTKSTQINLAIRNKQYEFLLVKQLQQILKDCELTFNNSNMYYYSNDDYDFTIDMSFISFLKQYAHTLMKSGYEIRFDNNKFHSGGGSTSIKISSGIDWFEVNTSYLDDDGNEEAIEIDPFLLKAGIIKTKKGYRALTQQELDKLLFLEEQGLSHNGKLKISKANLHLIDKLYKQKITDDRNSLKTQSSIYEKLSGFKGIKKTQVPAGFNASLRKYQQSGYDWLNFLHEYNINGILADDMGLGKTVQTLALLLKLHEQNELSPTLLVVPVTTIANWASEIERFTPVLRYTTHIGSNRKDNFNAIESFDIYITSYQTLCRDIENWQKIKLNYLILDESQNIKNSKSQRFKAVKLLNAAHRLSLSGTPVENNSTELWAQMDFLMPGLLGSLAEFRRNFTRPIEMNSNLKKAKLLRDIVFPFILRRKKEDVLHDLPPKDEIILYTEMENQQRKIYENLRKAMKEEIVKLIEKDNDGEKNNFSINKNYMPILAAMLKLRQIALFPQLVNHKYTGIPSCKFDLLRDYVTEIIEEGHKVLIFSQFVQTLAIIQSYFDECKIKYSYIDGQTKKRENQIERFQNETDVPLFLISLKAGGVGINLTKADYVILFDPWWNPAVENQAIDRAHRIGQKNKVIVYRLIVKNTIEEKIMQLQQKKKNLADSLISKDQAFFKSLDKNDLLNLFD